MTREEDVQLKTIEMAMPKMSEEDRDLGFGAKVATEICGVAILIVGCGDSSRVIVKIIPFFV